MCATRRPPGRRARPRRGGARCTSARRRSRRCGRTASGRGESPSSAIRRRIATSWSRSWKPPVAMIRSKTCCVRACIAVSDAYAVSTNVLLDRELVGHRAHRWASPLPIGQAVRMDDLTLMAVHAHPDDESNSTGGTLARYSAEGVRTVLVTCTNGEFGDAPGHIKPGEPGHDPDDVARIRLGELEGGHRGARRGARGDARLPRLGHARVAAERAPRRVPPPARRRRRRPLGRADRAVPPAGGGHVLRQLRLQPPRSPEGARRDRRRDRRERHPEQAVPDRAHARSYRERMREIAEEYGVELPPFMQPQPPAPPPAEGEPIPEAAAAAVRRRRLAHHHVHRRQPRTRRRSARHSRRTPASSRGRSSCSSPTRRSPRRSAPSRSSASATPPARRCRRTTSSPGCARSGRVTRRPVPRSRSGSKAAARSSSSARRPRVQREVDRVLGRHEHPLGDLELGCPRLELDARPHVRVVLEGPIGAPCSSSSTTRSAVRKRESTTRAHTSSQSSRAKFSAGSRPSWPPPGISQKPFDRP